MWHALSAGSPSWCSDSMLTRALKSIKPILSRLSQLAMRIGNFRGDGREFASQYKGRRSEIVCSIDQAPFHESEFVYDSPACI
jgi:hypothetical protein